MSLLVLGKIETRCLSFKHVLSSAMNIARAVHYWFVKPTASKHPLMRQGMGLGICCSEVKEEIQA
jgi:hypothetical protein